MTCRRAAAHRPSGPGQVVDFPVAAVACFLSDAATPDPVVDNLILTTTNLLDAAAASRPAAATRSSARSTATGPPRTAPGAPADPDLVPLPA